MCFINFYNIFFQKEIRFFYLFPLAIIQSQVLKYITHLIVARIS